MHASKHVHVQQNRVAFDVAASYEVLDTCVLAPLRQELAAHESVNADRVATLEAACEELDASQLAFRRAAMTLTDLESQLEEERQRVIATSAREQAWRERERRLMDEMDELNARLDAEKARWQQASDALQTEFDAHVRPAQLRHDDLVAKRDAMTRLVAETEASLLGHDHRLQHQLGVVDAANISFPDNRDVQLWSWSLLSVMLERIELLEGAEHDDVIQSDMLVLFDRATIDGVQRTLAAFTMDFEVVCTTLEVMVRLFRVFTNSADLRKKALGGAMEPFATRARDGSVLGTLAGVLSQWQSENAASRVLSLAFEALFFALKCTRASQQHVLRICQSRVIHTLCLRMLSEIEMDEDLTDERRWLAAHVSLMLYTLVKYGVKTPLVQRGTLRLVVELTQRLLNGANRSENEGLATIEALEHLFAALALLLMTRKSKTSTENSKEKAAAMQRELQLSDFPDADALDVELVLLVMQFASSVDSEAGRRQSTGCVYWSMRVLHHASLHVGAHAARVRSSLLSSKTAMTVVLDAITIGCQRHVAGDCVRVIDSGIDLLLAVWLERFDEEGRIRSTEPAVLLGLVDVVAFQVSCLSSNDSASALQLSDLARVWHPLATACANEKNVKILSELVVTANDDVPSLATSVSVALRWVVQPRGRDQRSIPRATACCALAVGARNVAADLRVPSAEEGDDGACGAHVVSHRRSVRDFSRAPDGQSD
ncbi:hypothetical protein PINS_up013021 [Pythium insidiosum]|nr:hypothetical protein PINS_up013021 [Pythium insidiosum]